MLADWLFRVGPGGAIRSGGGGRGGVGRAQVREACAAAVGATARARGARQVGLAGWLQAGDV